MNYNEPLKKIEDYITSFYKEHIDRTSLYHNFFHVKKVIRAASKIADHYLLEDRSRFIVVAAAWFYDAGFLKASTSSPEDKSAELAESFLLKSGINEEDINQVKRCILAVNKPSKDNSLLENIVCDAQQYHLGTKKFIKQNKLLQKETEGYNHDKTDLAGWLNQTISLLESHRYQTEYCRNSLDDMKAKNLQTLKIEHQQHFGMKKLETVSENGHHQHTEHFTDTTNKESGQHHKAVQQTVRSVETMFRITSSNSMTMSEMADGKAHIMISVNSIILSVILAVGTRSLDQTTAVFIPTMILLAVNVSTIVFSILATMPKLTKGVFKKEELDNRSLNILFYGNFYKMDFGEYRTAMKELIDDKEFLHDSLITDIYMQGKVLGRKYKYLNTAYWIFMHGIVVSVVAFTIAIFF